MPLTCSTQKLIVTIMVIITIYLFSQVYIHVYTYFGKKDIEFSQIKVQGIKSAI